jgi:hypothetical protein
MKNKKVYCNECDYLVRLFVEFRCKAPLNVIYTDCFLCQNTDYIEGPEVLNKDNNCSWWKTKEFKIE